MPEELDPVEAARKELAETLANADKNQRALLAQLAGVDPETALELGY